MKQKSKKQTKNVQKSNEAVLSNPLLAEELEKLANEPSPPVEPLEFFKVSEEVAETTESITEEVLPVETLMSEELPAVEEANAEPDAIPQNLELVQVRSVIESLLLAYDKPVNMSLLKEVFKGSSTPTDVIRRALSDLMVEYQGAERGFSLNEVGGGYQLRTKSENQVFVRRLVKGRQFRLSGPALEVLSIIAYKQPIIKAEVDSIRGVESGHLVRALMDRGLVKFVGKSELPGKPMLYGTSRKFLEIFGLRDLRELPSLAEIDDLLPDGILEEDEKTPERDWSQIQEMSMQVENDTSKEEEWEKITLEIKKIETTTQFFEDEKKREKERKDLEKAEGIREALAAGEEVNSRDVKWLKRFEAQLAAAANMAAPVPTSDPASEPTTQEAIPEAPQDPSEVEANTDEPREKQSESDDKKEEISEESSEGEQSPLDEFQKNQWKKALDLFDNED